VLVPRLGLVRALAVLAFAGALLGALAIAKAGRWRSRLLAGSLGAAVALLAVAIPSDRLARLLAEKRGGTLVFYDEDVGGTVAVLEQRSPSTGAPFRRLYIQGVSNSGDALPSLRYMRLQALLPLLVHPGEPRSILVLGFGTGITAGATLASPVPEKRVVSVTGAKSCCVA
jgi:spermidine synthase